MVVCCLLYGCFLAVPPPKLASMQSVGDSAHVGGRWVGEQLGTTSEPLREERRRSLTAAIASMDRALELGPPYGHLEDPEMSRKVIEERLLEWRLELHEA